MDANIGDWRVIWKYDYMNKAESQVYTDRAEAYYQFDKLCKNSRVSSASLFRKARLVKEKSLIKTARKNGINQDQEKLF